MVSERQRQNLRCLSHRQEKSFGVSGKTTSFLPFNVFRPFIFIVGVHAGPFAWLDCRRFWLGIVPEKLHLVGKQRVIFVPLGCGSRQWHLLWISRPAHRATAEHNQVTFQMELTRLPYTVYRRIQYSMEYFANTFCKFPIHWTQFHLRKSQ